MEYTRLRDVNVKEYIGKRIYIIFMATKVEVRPQQGNKEYLMLSMTDGPIKTEAKIFDINDEIKSKVTAGKAYRAAVDIKVYDRSPSGYSCIIYGMEEEEDADVTDFVDRVRDSKKYEANVMNALEVVKNTVYGDAAYSILSKYWGRFIVWPAANSEHHDLLGGLIMHTATVTKLAIRDAQLYNEIYGENFINLPLLISGALLHDVMKTKEYKVELDTGETDFSLEAALQSHIMDIQSELDLYAISKGIYDTEEMRLLKHVVVAHHGKMEWGSPIEHAVPEAYLLHKADQTDAEMFKYNREFIEIKAGEKSAKWAHGKIKVVYKEINKK